LPSVARSDAVLGRTEMQVLSMTFNSGAIGHAHHRA
jgi:hypothetical protein